MDNNYPNMMEGNKPPTSGGHGQSSAGQSHISVGQGHTAVNSASVYNCGLCGKEFFHYRDLALHERMHIEEMTRSVSSQAVAAGGVQTRPGYDNRAVPPTGLGGYSTASGAASSTQLESFEKLIQPFRGDLEMRGQTNPRSVVSATPTSQESDRGQPQQVYRNEESRNVPVVSRSAPVDSRSLTLASRTVAMDTRPHVDPRPISVEGRGLQAMDRSAVPDSRGGVPPIGLDSRGGSASYLETLNRSLYTGNTASKPHSATMSSFTPVTPNVRSEDYFIGENRSQSMPKMESQIYSKPDPYYSHSKSPYSLHGGTGKMPENFSASPYGLSKGLNTQPYYPQPLPAQPQARYDLEKIPAPSPLGYYNQPGAGLLGSKPDKKLPSPKPTLYYGQAPQSQASTLPANSHFQMTNPKSNHLNEASRNIQNKILDPKLDIARSYQGANASPHPTFAEIYKGNQPQSQVYSSVSSPVAPSQLDYGAYKLTSEPIPTVNIDSKQPPRLSQPECVCYICGAPFSDMYALSEHIKFHAMDTNTPINPPNPPPHPMHLQSQIKKENPVASSGGVRLPPAAIPTALASPSPAIVNQKMNNKQKGQKKFMCEVCEEKFLTERLLSEHLKVHMEEAEFECKVCKKGFNKQSKCVRHEALHQKNILLFYCEICAESFKYKGNYLYHMQKEHSSETVSDALKSGSITKSVPNSQSMQKDSNIKQEIFPYTNSNNGQKTVVDCQVCDEEIDQSALVAHLKTHAVHTCDKCDRIFVQKTEYVEHLMHVHLSELSDSSDNSDSESSDGDGDNEREDSESDDDDASPLSVEMDGIKSETGVNGSKETKTKEKIGIKNLKEKKKEVMKNLKEKQQEITDLEKKKKKKDKEKKFITLKKVEVTDVPDLKLKFSCSKCNKSFAKKGDLTQHVETHKKDPDLIYCEVCDASYGLKEKGYYIYHMKGHKDQELDSKQVESLPCKICQAVIPKNGFVSHVKKQHSQFSCDICRWSYSGEKALVKHMKSIHAAGKKYKFVKKTSDEEDVDVKPAPVVYMKLKDIVAMEKKKEDTIQKEKPVKKIVCEICNHSFAKKFHFDRHLKVHNITPEEAVIPCELCNAPCASRGVYLYHIQKCHGNTDESQAEGQQGQIGEKVNKTMESIGQDTVVKVERNLDEKESLESVNQDVVVKVEKNYDEMENEAQTLNLDHGNGNTNESQAEHQQGQMGEKVDQTIESVTPDIVVKVEKNLDETENKDQAPDTLKLTVKTKECSKEIGDESKNMEGNAVKGNDVTNENNSQDAINAVVHGEKSSKEEDNEGKGIDSEMKDPKKPLDVVGEIIYCKLCNISLKRNTLHDHIKEHSTYNCDFCGYSFVKRKTYLHHQKVVHMEDVVAEEVQKIEDMKGKKNDDGGKRKRSDVLKFVSCAICTGEYKADKYIEHVQGHAATRLYCQFCNMCISKKQNLTVHETSHARIVFSESELPYARHCPICDESMTSRDSYVAHICSHSKRTPVMCKICGKLFVYERNLHHHKRVYHDPNIRISWKVDGEGLKFDVRTGRVAEVTSETLFEIKEINELLLSHGKPEIWAAVTPKKLPKQKVVPKEIKYADDEEAFKTDDEEKVKTDSSDEDYVPEPTDMRRSGRKRSTRGTTNGSDDDEEEDDEDDDDEDEDDEYVPHKKQKVRKTGYNSDDDISEEEYTPKGTRTRKVANSNQASEESSPRGKLKKKALRKSMQENQLKSRRSRDGMSEKRKHDDDDITPSPISAKRPRRQSLDESAEENQKLKKTPVKGKGKRKRRSDFNPHIKGHNELKPFHCPVCNNSFTRIDNLKVHMRDHHRNYKGSIEKSANSSPVADTQIKSKLRTRAANVSADDLGKPVSTSTPIKLQRLSVVLSHVDVSAERDKIDRSSDKEKKDKSAKEKTDKSSNKIETYVCEYCNKKIHNNNWRNYEQHLLTHKKEAQDKEKESEPFSCKLCSESFKKKRDLYIHAKIHSREPIDDDDENTMDVSYTSTEMGEITKSSENTSAESVNDSSLNLRNRNQSSANQSDDSSNDKTHLNGSKDENIANSRPKRSSRSSTSNGIEGKTANSPGGKNGNGKALNKTDKIKHEEKQKGTNDKLRTIKVENNDEGQESVGSDRQTLVSISSSETEQKHIMKDQTSCLERSDKKPAQGIDIVRRNSENSRSESESVIGNTNGDDSENEVSKHTKSAPSVKKMSSESARSKWKMKVRSTLASQLELNATKMQELEKPEIAKVNKYLSISGKPEKLIFECRICGDMFNLEAAFRSHMEVHLDELPPYCSICDIYFMAIYPKRRLLEHNKKKHPELLEKAATAAAASSSSFAAGSS